MKDNNYFKYHPNCLMTDLRHVFDCFKIYHFSAHKTESVFSLVSFICDGQNILLVNDFIFAGIYEHVSIILGLTQLSVSY